MNIRIDRPTLNKGNADNNIAIVDRWIADTADKLNMYVMDNDRQMEELSKKNSDTYSYLETIANILERNIDTIVSLKMENEALKEMIDSLAIRVETLEEKHIEGDDGK